jgi:hypothetical protein
MSSKIGVYGTISAGTAAGPAAAVKRRTVANSINPSREYEIGNKSPALSYPPPAALQQKVSS